MGHLKLLEEDHTQLFRRINIKSLAGQIIDLLFQFHDPRPQLIPVGFQCLRLDFHAGLFHMIKGKYERHLDLPEQPLHAGLFQFLRKHRRRSEGGICLIAGFRRLVRLLIDQHPEMLPGNVVILIITLQRVQKIRRHNIVKTSAAVRRCQVRQELKRVLQPAHGKAGNLRRQLRHPCRKFIEIHFHIAGDGHDLFRPPCQRDPAVSGRMGKERQYISRIPGKCSAHARRLRRFRKDPVDLLPVRHLPESGLHVIRHPLHIKPAEHIFKLQLLEELVGRACIRIPVAG